MQDRIQSIDVFWAFLFVYGNHAAVTQSWNLKHVFLYIHILGNVRKGGDLIVP